MAAVYLSARDKPCSIVWKIGEDAPSRNSHNASGTIQKLAEFHNLNPYAAGG